MYYNAHMEYRHVRIWKTTLKKLRVMAAARDMSIIALIEALVTAENEREAKPK